jgi:hypothetical protein
MSEPREIAIVTNPDGQRAGKPPSEVSQEEFKALGHVAMAPLKVIREKCLECCCGSTGEVRECPITTCPLWPYRMGTNPLRQPSPGRQQRGRELARARRRHEEDEGVRH